MPGDAALTAAATAATAAFTVLGPIGVAVDGRPVRIPGRRERAVLAVLLAARRAPVTPDRLVDEVWGASAPESAQASLQVAISRLRAVLEPGRSRSDAPRLLLSSRAGYALLPGPGAIDAERLLTLATQAHEALPQDPAQAAARCGEAEALWQGTPYADEIASDLVQAERTRLSDLRLQVQEVRIEALLALGRHGLVVGELDALVEAHPFRERLWESYALALYRAGRQADALAALRTVRHRLADELGVDPSPALQHLEQRILTHDPSLTAAVPPRPAGSDTALGSRVPGRSVLVGRDVEFAQLRALLAAAGAGETVFAVVEGEPGIGKTRLLEETAGSARRSGFHVLWGRCSQTEMTPAFWPWLEVLRGLPNELPGVALVPDVAALLDPAGSGPGDLTQERRFRVFDAVARTLAAAAARTPLLVVLEDLHWADPASADLLRHLAGSLYGAGVAVAVSLRELHLGRRDAVAEAVAAISARPGTVRLVLAGVTPSASAALVSGVAETPVPPGVAAAIHRRGEGNPFCMGELTRLLAATEGLGDPAAVDRADVPVGVRDVVRWRLASLPDATRRLLEVAAVIGRDFDLGVLVAASGLSLDGAADALEPALVSRVVVPVTELPGRHRFAHALVTEAALADLSSLRAAALHARVAEALTDLGGDSNLEVVAAHLWAAAAVVGADRAAEALERAAEVSIRRTAYENAQDLLERALALRGTVGAGGRDADEAELVGTLRLAGLRRARFGYSRAFEAIPLERPKALADRTGRTDLYMGLLHLHWGALATSAQVEAATELARQLRDLGAASSDPVEQLLGAQCWGVQCWHLGRLAEAADCMARVDRAIRGLDSADAARLAMFDSPAFFAAFALHVLELAGRAPDADARFEQIVAEYATPYEVAVVANFSAFSAVNAGDAPRALRWARRGMRTDAEREFGMFGATAQMYGGWAMACLGDAQEGLAVFTRGLERFRQADARVAMGALVCLQVEAMLAAERPLHEVERALCEGVAEAVALGEPLTLAFLDCARAELAGRRGDPGATRAALAAAAADAEATSNVLLRARVTAAAARWAAPADALAGGATTARTAW